MVSYAGELQAKIVAGPEKGTSVGTFEKTGPFLQLYRNGFL
jgi:hypothetical protein